MADARAPAQARPSLHLGMVVPRYGKEIVGGAELHARQLAQRLAGCGHTVDILTTTALDHYNWDEALEPGVEEDGPLRIRRFPVDERDVGIHRELENAIVGGWPVTREEERMWMRHGLSTSAMEDWLAAKGDRYDAILAMPYLYGTSYFTAMTRPERTLLIPCLHDEPYVRLQVVSEMLSAVHGVLFNSYPEARLGQTMAGLRGPNAVAGGLERWAVVGLGFEAGRPGDPGLRGPNAVVDAFRRRHRINSPFVLSVGRREGGKNTPLLIEYFQQYKSRRGGDLVLVQAGSGEIPLPRRPDVIDLEPDWRERDAMYRASTIFCQPSVNESLSIVMMQAWLAERPIIVHGDGMVTRDHCERADGGLWFRSYAEFEAVVDAILADPDLRRALGRNGRAYVERVYSWDAVLGRFHDAVYEWIS